jgi:hypothetical protein
MHFVCFRRRADARTATHFLLLLLLLSACSSGNDAAPSPARPTDAATPTLAPGQTRVGDLLARAEASWSSVSNLRSVFTSTQTTSSGTAAGQREVVVEEIKPDRRRVVIRQDGAVIDEQIVVEGVIYLRGSFVAGLVAPNVGAETWVTVDPALVPPDTPVGQQMSALTAPIAPPYQTVSAETRALPATAAGRVDVEGRSCAAFTFSARDATSGGQIDYTLALDDTDRLCALDQTAGAVTNRTIFTYNLPELTIEAPLAATPVSGTPEG